MSSQKGARSKLADVLADIKNSRAEDEYDYSAHDVAPAPAKRRLAVNYVALSGHTPRQNRSSSANASSASQSSYLDPKTASIPSNVSSRPRTRSHILKLFDRTVDLAQFCRSQNHETALYPICRAWVHGHKIGNQLQSKNHIKQQDDKLNGSLTTTQQESSGETATEVHCLPPPKSKSDMIKQFNLASDDKDIDIRIPQSVRNYKISADVEETVDRSIQSMDHRECMELNKQRWKAVRKDWLEARRFHESRYEDSFKVLQDMFLSSQRGV